MPKEIERLDAEGLVQLLLKGGISTVATANELAGRGIGLDVVREAALRLGGEIKVETEPGKGTRIALIVPVSLSTLEALLMEAGGTVVALPAQSVRRTLRIAVEEGARDTILHDGAAIPLTPLDGLLPRLPGVARAAPPRVAVVVAGETANAAIAVENLLGVATLVVQPLPGTVRADPMVAGAALDADGVPRLVLDPERLVAAARAAPPAEIAAPPAAKAPILVIDDSLTTRMLEQSILESAGFEVDLAVSAEDALGKAALRRYGLFLVDVEMPGMDGFSFVAQTRADANFRAIPALLVSSRNGDDDRRRASEAGASGYIVKGEFDQTRFLDTIRRLAG
jgi:two-component system chemotaxis sensor kinase CheA